jgi:hypothetical protein
VRGLDPPNTSGAGPTPDVNPFHPEFPWGVNPFRLRGRYRESMRVEVAPPPSYINLGDRGRGWLLAAPIAALS